MSDAEDLFLIAHKVRGEAAFDIAQQILCPICQGNLFKAIGLEADEPCDCSAGFWWVIPTSGHRAYPWWEIPFSHLLGDMDQPLLWHIPPMPDGLLDHYAANDRPSTTPTQAKIDLRSLGLIRPKPLIDRRI